jgi:alkaline phosphatase
MTKTHFRPRFRLLAPACGLALAACASTAPTAVPAAAPPVPQSAGLHVDVPAVAHPSGETPAWWYRDGAAQAAARGATAGRAKNVIVFLGDGMSLPTVAAARILEGQRKGGSGEENRLSWENFPATALSKTYNTDSQTPDSAGTMTAITTGVKSHMGAIGVYAGDKNDCAGSLGKQAQTWLELADAAGMATGIVTTARITHATPAATYAHVPNRNWENDAALPKQAVAEGCKDIARQLIEATRDGRGPSIVLGGGRKEFLTVAQTDPQQPDKKGLRRDGRDLIAEWRGAHPQGAYATDAAQLAAAANAPSVLGLFNYDHLQFDHDRRANGAIEPSLADMTRAAIAHLSRGGNGYVLMVEGAKIDMASHEGNAFRALDETIAFSDAVRAAAEATSTDDTLILVTADHAHTLTFVGYPARGNPILGKVRGSNSFDGEPGKLALDLSGKPYTTLVYANGPGNTGASEEQPAGPKRHPHWPKQLLAPANGRPDLTDVDTADPDYMQEALVPLSGESHGGDDVGIWARGPGSDAVRGSLEQNAIYHIVVQATPRLREALCAKRLCDGNGVPVELPRSGDFKPE